MEKYAKLKDYSPTQFRRLTGVQRETFEKMIQILKDSKLLVIGTETDENDLVYVSILLPGSITMKLSINDKRIYLTQRQGLDFSIF